MKRFFLFAILFGGGLYLLIHISQKQKAEKVERVEADQDLLVNDPREEELPFTRIPEMTEPEVLPEAGATDTGDETGIAGTVKGEVSFSVREEEEPRNLIYEVHLENVQPRGDDYYDVKGLRIRAFDTDTELLRTTFEAREGLVRIEWDGTRLAIGRSERVQLTDATVTLHQGSPMAPMTLTLPEAELDLENGSLFSSAAVNVIGEGVTGTGIGLELLERGKNLNLLREGVMTLRSDEKTNVKLVAAKQSPIELKRLPMREDLERIEIRLPGGGELIAKGETPFRVKADDLALDGRVIYVDEKTPTSTTRRRVFRAEYAKLLGNVDIHHDEHQTTSGVAQIFFDALGGIRRLRLEEQPVVKGEMDISSADPDKQEPVAVEIRGLGPMEITYNAASPAAELDLQGPSTIEAKEIDLRLDAEEGIHGSFWGRGLADTQLHGAVTGAFEGMSFEGSNLSIRGRESEDRAQHLFFETKDPSHMHGPDPKGDLVDLTTGGALNLVVDREDVELILARDVTVVWGGKQSWTATMGEVHNLDLETGSFTATGGVDYEGLLGSGTAARAVGHSFEHLELFGEGNEPAIYSIDPDASRELELGLLRAMHLDLQKDRALADQAVELRFVGEKLREEIDCGRFVLRPLGESVAGEPTPFEFEADDVTRALIVAEEAESILSADKVSGHGTFTQFEDPEASTVFDLIELQAEGNVVVGYSGDAGDFTARGGRVTWSGDGRGRLEAAAGERVQARGRFSEDGLPYLLTATWIEYGDEEMQALFPEITLDRPAALPLLLGERAATELYAGSAEWMTSDAGGLLLAGNAHFAGKTRDGDQIDLNAGSIHLTRSADSDSRTSGADELVAWDGFKLQLEDDLVGTGEIFQAGYQLLRFEGRPARLEVHGFAWEASNIVYDVPRVLVTTDQGRLYGAAGSGAEGWVATYESLQPFEDEDSTMMVMRNLSIRNGEREIRANWATFWLDREEWLQKTQHWIDGTEEEQPGAPVGPEPEPEAAQAPTLFGRFDSGALSKVWKELYLEGNVEVLDSGDPVARMEAAYVDMVDGHGWIQKCELFMDIKVGRVQTDLIVRADWLRHSADGSLSADSAHVTACGYAEPHYYIETKNLRMKPVGETSSVWDILLKDNALVFDNGLSIPLPRVHYKSDGKGRPTFSALGFGNSARYGSFVEASVEVDVGQDMSDYMAPILNSKPEDIDGNYRIRASYYASRGLLLDQRFRLTADDHFWMNIFLDGIYDSGEDRGLLRYKGEGGDGLRWILAAQSRYLLSSDEWFDFSLAEQSDAGVQAEFTESQFVRYERRDNFLRWRKAQGEHYYSANLRYRLDSFRNEVERLPDLGYMRGMTPVGNVWGQPLLYTASADAAYLRVRQAEGTVISPFDPNLDPALGDREVLRADTRHRIETPFELGLWGMRMSPFFELVGTAWSEGVNEQDSPSRGAAIAGVEAQSSFYRTWSHGVVNTVTPFAGVHGDLASFEENGTQMQLDATDESVTGRFMDLGLRSRWRRPGGARYLDTAVRMTHATDVAVDEEEGWRPVRVLGELLAVYEKIPYAITHDGKYDLDEGDTTHSYTSFSFLPWYDVGVEIGYNRGLDQQRKVLFDAVSLGTRWNATSKWQVEGRQSVSQISGSALSTDFTLRRLGHDFIFEVAYGFRSGEGGNTLSFKYRPLLGWREPSFGLMQALQRARL